MMKRWGFVAVAGLFGAGLLVQAGGAGPIGGGERIMIAATSAVVAGGDYEYKGSKSCKKCHIPQFKSWEKGKKGQALEVLKPGEASEAKTKHGLDPAKDYSQDESCLKCHVTGFGHPSGYSTPDPEDKRAVRRAKSLSGVGCESCHGPGSAYIKIFEEITKSKRKYKVEELHAAGLSKLEASRCTTCHNDESPTFEGFDYEKMKEQGAHDHVELKQREG